jgi:prepilin-type N-terminal cleavage/methylation domain-containing protein
MTTDEPEPSPEAGFSMVEVIVAMSLLAMVALLTVPFFALSLTQAATTSTRTSAGAKVADLLERVRAAPTCTTPAAAGARALTAGTEGPFHDAQGRAFTVSLEVSPGCAPDTAVQVTATARRVSDSVVLAHAATVVYVP